MTHSMRVVRRTPDGVEVCYSSNCPLCGRADETWMRAAGTIKTPFFCESCNRGWQGPTPRDFEESQPNPKPAPTPPDSRKAAPLYSGCLAYFPNALAAVARLSKIGNDKHNPGEPLHWSRDKSNDHADCLARHLVEQGTIDPETGLSHTVSVAWRALALLQVELEASRPDAK